jgi:cysteine desulfurase
MLPYFGPRFGNAASRSHAFGWEAEKAVDRARRQIADLIGASGRELVFTSGATEGDNLVLIGALRQFKARGQHIVTCTTEHKAVLDTCAFLETSGAEVSYLQPDKEGRLSPDQVAEAIRKDTVLVALMGANNELGTLHPIKEIGALCKQRGVLFFVDAAQAVGKIPMNVEKMHIDLLTMSAHKFYGPKGVGAVFVRRRNPTVRLEPLLHGGGQERGMRSGTLNVPGIVGMGEAAHFASQELETEGPKLAALRDHFEGEILRQLDHVQINGSKQFRLPGTSNMSYRYVEGEALMMSLKGLAVSSGSACSSTRLAISHVLNAIGVEQDMAQASLRVSFGRFNTEDDVAKAIQEIVAAVTRLREVHPGYPGAPNS